MTSLHPFMRLKVKGDTFYLPDANGGVYFRNNRSSFQLEGKGIDRWIEKLMPVFNGHHTLEDLTEGLPDEYRNRVHDIATVLIQNGMVRDVSQDQPHELAAWVLDVYASQIEFLDSFAGSGAALFQLYRQAKVLAVGSGSIFLSLVQAMFTSGLPKLHLLITDAFPTNRERIAQLESDARLSDSYAAIEWVLPLPDSELAWQQAVQPYDAILYVSEQSDPKELSSIEFACRMEQKLLLTAVSLHQVGIAGPMVLPDKPGGLQSALRRLHRQAICKDPMLHRFSSTAGAMLANVIVFELLKTVTKVSDSELKNQLFLLNLETLEGSWHSFLPHPLESDRSVGGWISAEELRIETNSSSRSQSSELIPLFSSLTSSVCGIFEAWEEGELQQLPLAQCLVRPVDPLSEGPAELLPEIICSGLTHDEARREAGLAGIEAYLSRLVHVRDFPSSIGSQADAAGGRPQEWIGAGVGETKSEAICRGLQQCLERELAKRNQEQSRQIVPVAACEIEDERCEFYLEALTAKEGAPLLIATGEELFGFPVVWVKAGGGWYAGSGLNVTFALRKALQQALLPAQNPGKQFHTLSPEMPIIQKQEDTDSVLLIPACKELVEANYLQFAAQLLKKHNKRLWICDLAVESFLQEPLAGAFGVMLGKGESK